MKVLSSSRFKTRHVKREVLLLFAFCSLLVGTACDKTRIYEENKDLKDKQWFIDSVQTFSFKVGDATKPYNLFLNLRNTESYPYYNLFLRYYLVDSLQKEVKSQQVELILMDPVTGKPTGNGLGDIFSHQYELLQHFVFPKPGLYHVKLKQYMRQEPLPEINSVGVRLEHFVPKEEKQ